MILLGKMTENIKFHERLRRNWRIGEYFSLLSLASCAIFEYGSINYLTEAAKSNYNGEIAVGIGGICISTAGVLVSGLAARLCSKNAKECKRKIDELEES